MLDKLDKILLSNDVVDNFYKMFNTAEFREWILNILPEIEDCKNLKQDNPWHIYNCLDHILHSVSAINLQSEGLKDNTRRLLAYTMFLHDIGKPECHIRRYSKMYGRKIDSFFNHNKASVKIADRVLPQFNFSEEDCCIIKKLIDMHDIFMFIRLSDDNNPYHQVLNKEYINQKIEELNSVGNGTDLLKLLIKIGKADNLSQNPQMTANSLQLLEVFDDMLDNVIEP